MKKLVSLRRGLSVLLVLAALVCAAVPAQAAAEPEWKDNLIVEKPLDRMVKKESMYTVTFLDTLEDAPERTWHLGQQGVTDQVQGWVKWENGKGHVFIGAEGGINGRDACKELFTECNNLEEIRFNGAFHTDETKCMTDMFYKCFSLKSVDVETLNTANVTSMYQMFRSCWSLEALDLSKMDTANVKTMYCMFSTCKALKELDLSTFDTGKVTNMGYMFSACSALERVEASGFDTSEVVYMAGTFLWCDKLEDYDFSKWDVSNVTHCSGFMNDGMKIGGADWEAFFS